MGKWAGYLEQGSQSINNTETWLPESEDYNIVGGGNFVPGTNIGANDLNLYQPAPEEPEWDPTSGTEAPRAWNIHYTPTWFMEEQDRRSNPAYTPEDTRWSNEQVNSIANYVSGMKTQHPNEWRYGDPGWDTSTDLWREHIKPYEDEYQEEAAAQKKAEAVQMDQQTGQPAQPTQQPGQQYQYYSFHNNNVKTTELAPYQGGTNNGPILTQDEIDRIQSGNPYNYKVDTSKADYNELSNSGKFLNRSMPSTAGTDVKNNPWLNRWTQPLLGSFFSASGPAAIAKIITAAIGGPVGLISGVVWGASFAYSYLKGTGLIKGNAAVDKALELTDILDEKGAQVQAALAYGFEKAGGGDYTDWSKAGENLDFIINNFGTIMHYAFGEGKASSEYNADIVGMIGSLTPNIGANVIGVEGQGISRFVRSLGSNILDAPEDKYWLKRNETTRSNSGLSGVYEIPEEMLGTNAITYWLNYAQYLYDHGVTNMAQLEYIVGNAINEVYGDLSNMSEFLEHELGDPGNITENMQSRAINAYGTVTGDANMAKAAAANTGSLIGDLTGNIPVVPDVARFIAKLAGNNEFLKTSGGIDEVIGTWDMNNLQTTDPTQLTARDRRLSHITPDGKTTRLDPLTNPNTIKNPFAQGWEKIKQLFSTTNEFRATTVGDSIINFIYVGVEDALKARPNEDPSVRIQRVKDFVNELQNPETISDNSPFKAPSKTILFNTIKDDLAMAVRSHRTEIDKIINDYASLEPNREILGTLAEALGMTPHKLLEKYQNEKTLLAQMIVNKADQNGGKIPGIDIDVEGRDFGDRVMAMLSPFVGDKAKPYDPRAMMNQITTEIGDGVMDTLINKYGIEQEGWVYRFGDTIKKIQNLWLLGLSPSYLANNVANNILTRSAIGWGGFLSSKTINEWTDRFGYTPERFAESNSEVALEKEPKTPSEKLRAAIRDKRKKGYKVFDSLDKKAEWTTEHLGFFEKISGWVEKKESEQIYTSAMMTYMARTWKPGVNFRKMDTQLENMIREKDPALLDSIYAAISSGVNMEEIENAIYGAFIIPNIQDVLVDAARQCGITDAEDVIIELFQKGGMYQELQQALKGKRGNEIDDAIAKIIKRAEAIAQIHLAEDLAARAKQVANDTANYGFAEVCQLAQDMAQNMADVWIGSQDANTQIFDRRIAEGMKTAEFRAIYQEHQKALNEQWAGVYATAQQNYNGILKGLGFADPTTKSYVDKMIQRDNLWVNFYQNRQPELFAPYLEALNWRSDDTFETWDSRVKQAWKDYQKAITTEYDNTIKAERNMQVEMDNIFADGLKACLSDTNASKVDTIIKPLQEQIRNKRAEIVAKNKEIRASTDKTSLINEKSRVYHENNLERQKLVKEYGELQQQLYDEIRKLGPATEPRKANSATDTPDPAADIRADVTERRAEQVERKAEEFSEKAVDYITENEEVPDLNDGYEDTVTEPDNIVHLTPEQVQSNLETGTPVPLSDIDIAKIEETTPERLGEIVYNIARIFSEMDSADPVHQKENMLPPFSQEQYGDYIIELINGESVLNENGEPTLSEQDKARIRIKLEKYDVDSKANKMIDALKKHLLYDPEKLDQKGDYVVQADTFEYGAQTIVGAVFHNGELVAYVPKNMELTSVEIGPNDSVRVLGVSTTNPDLWVYLDGDKVYTQKKREPKVLNTMNGDAESDSLGAIDPGGQAAHKLTYEQIVPILQEFRDLYKRALNDAMANKKFSMLDDNTKELVRQYIDNDVRTDLMNTKYKTGKFGEMMRDAALLNYNKRYGFDNMMSLLFPYQFWNTRSFMNWINRMSGKGGKMWRRYARLKRLEEMNKKELMPSRTSGKVGIYLPFLPDWMGDALFMPTSQLSIVGNFVDPAFDWASDNSSINASAERYVQEAFDRDEITLDEYRDAMDPAKRNGSAVWQEMYAKAQTEGDNEKDLGNLFKQYFGMALPVSIGKAILTGNPDEWSQTPMTRTGTAFRALFGDNIVGKGAEAVLSAPEKALRSAVVALTENNDFRYQEFGSWGDYYIRNQVWDMVVEGRISPEEAITAQAEKDGNKIWDEAAQRQRMEVLQKTQLLSTTMPFKEFVNDVKNGNTDEFKGDFYYLLASLLTTWTPTSVVRDAEHTWREQSAELSQLFDTGTKEDRKKFYQANPNYTYKNLRYEADPEQALRSYLYKTITNAWYSLDSAEQAKLKITLGTDFQRGILDKDTRAIETMDLDKLAAYAQALNGSIPYLATDDLNTTNVPKINTNVIPQTEVVDYRTYTDLREKLYPGMADVENIYYSIPVEDRKMFREANPELTKYMEWKKTYQEQHPNVKNFAKRQTDYYNTIEAEDVFALLDSSTIKQITVAAYSGKTLEDPWKTSVVRAMINAGVSDKYEDFEKVLKNYILGN